MQTVLAQSEIEKENDGGMNFMTSKAKKKFAFLCKKLKENVYRQTLTYVYTRETYRGAFQLKKTLVEDSVQQ